MQRKHGRQLNEAHHSLHLLQVARKLAEVQKSQLDAQRQAGACHDSIRNDSNMTRNYDVTVIITVEKRNGNTVPT